MGAFPAVVTAHRPAIGEGLRDLPVAARVYLFAVLVAGLAALVLSSPTTIAEPGLFLALIISSAVAARLEVSAPGPSSESTMSVSSAVDFVAVLLLGGDEAMLVAGASACAQWAPRSRTHTPSYQTPFAAASLVLAVKITGWVYARLGGPPPSVPFSVLLAPRPIIGAATVYLVCNTVLRATAVGLASGTSVTRTWVDLVLESGPSYVVGAGAAALVGTIIDAGAPWRLAMITAPLYLTYRTYRISWDRVREERRYRQQASDLHLATIEALALAIDAKDQSVQRHIRRVEAYASDVAKALGMTDSEVEGVRTAAVLHDIGKLAVPEYILSKPGPLTDEEFERIRIHPKIGAEIVRGVPFPYPVVPFILSHHERWDGRGYPEGLAGEAIPLGARVIAVADCFGALTSDRPHRKALSTDAALAVLLDERGRGLDPRVVDTFVARYHVLEKTVLRETVASLEPGDVTPVRDELLAATAGNHANVDAARVFEDIAHANSEIYALHDIAEALGSSLGLGDTMALIAAKLDAIAPFSCCALFLYLEKDDSLRCGAAVGIDADVVQQLIIPAGLGLTGWVARNRQPLFNLHPSADFEAGGRAGTPTRLRSALICPLLLHGRLIATLSVYHTEPSIYTADHLRLVERIAPQAAAVVSNSLVFEQTKEDSLTDPLTGLPNRRFMALHMGRELPRAERESAPLSLLVVDLDHFKAINDTYGHGAGDRALRAVAGILRATIRPYDVCIRYAGDEFVIVLTLCSEAEAERKRRKLQRAVALARFEPRLGQVLPLSVSVGAATFPADGATSETLLATADSRMFRDKAAHRQSGPISRTRATG